MTAMNDHDKLRALAVKWREQGDSAMRNSGTWSGDQMANRVQWMADELEAALAALGGKGEAPGLRAALEIVLPYARHADSCGDMDAYNNATVESCGCGLDSAKEYAYEALAGATHPEAQPYAEGSVERDMMLYGTAFTVGGKRVDPREVFVHTQPEAQGEAVAWLHQVVGDDGEPDQALSFSRDSFPLEGVAGYKSVSVRPLVYGDTAAPKPVEGVPDARKLSAWVGDMRTSAGMDYYVCVGYGKKRGEYLTPHMYKIRGRAEYDVAEWNHLFGLGPKPDILAYDTEPAATLTAAQQQEKK